MVVAVVACRTAHRWTHVAMDRSSMSLRSMGYRTAVAVSRISRWIKCVVKETFWIDSRVCNAVGEVRASIYSCTIYDLYIPGNETKETTENTYVNLITVTHMPEETCKQECLLCETDTPGLTPTLPQ